MESTKPTGTVGVNHHPGIDSHIARRTSLQGVWKRHSTWRQYFQKSVWNRAPDTYSISLRYFCVRGSVSGVAYVLPWWALSAAALAVHLIRLLESCWMLIQAASSVFQGCLLLSGRSCWLTDLSILTWNSVAGAWRPLPACGALLRNVALLLRLLSVTYISGLQPGFRGT